MKKVFLTIVLILSVMSTAFGQRFQGATEIVDYKESSARVVTIGHSILTTPFIADLELIPGKNGESKIEEVITEPFANYVVTRDLVSMIPNFRAIALTEAAKRHNADVILGVLFEVVTEFEDESSPGKLKIIVSGYPAKYVNFRIAKMDEIELIRRASLVNQSSDENTDVVSDDPDHKSSIFKERVQILK